jgi:glutamyl-tRNA synthetase
VHAVRVAVSGKPVGFGLFDILSILGRERVVARLDCALARLAAG